MVGGSGECAASERGNVHAAQSIVEALDVAEQHLSVRHHVMTEGYRLSALQMCISGHDSLGVLIGYAAEYLDKRYHKLPQFLDGVAEIEAYVKRDLVVS